MKQLIFILSFFLIGQAGAQTTSLVGKWKSTQKDGIYYMSFAKDSTFLFKFGKDSIGGKNFMLGEGEAFTAFRADTSFKPSHLDLLVFQTATGKVIRTMECIYEIIGPNKIRIRLNLEEDPRPKTFLPKGNEDTMVFVKM